MTVAQPEDDQGDEQGQEPPGQRPPPARRGRGERTAGLDERLAPQTDLQPGDEDEGLGADQPAPEVGDGALGGRQQLDVSGDQADEQQAADGVETGVAAAGDSVAGLRRTLRSTMGRDWIAVVGGTAYPLRTAEDA